MEYEEKDYFDLESLTAELDEELKNGTLEDEVVEDELVDEPLEETEDDNPEEPVVEEEPVDNPEETDNPEEPVVEDDNPEEPVVEDDELHKRNEAFKELRLEKERLAKEAEFVKQLADSYGMSVEEMRTRFEEDRAKKEAEKQGLNIEQYKKMQELESKVKLLEDSRLEERFNMYADKFITEKKLTDEQFRNLAVESTKMGFDLLRNPEYIETAWKALNYDSAIAEGKQAQLAETKRRRATSAGSTGTVGGNVVEVNNYDKEIDNFLREQGVID